MHTSQHWNPIGRVPVCKRSDLLKKKKKQTQKCAPGILATSTPKIIDAKKN